MNRTATTTSLLVFTLLAFLFVHFTMGAVATNRGGFTDMLAVVGNFLAFSFFTTLVVKQASALTRRT